MDVVLFTDCNAYLPNGKLSLPIRMAGPFRLATELRLNNITCQIIDFIWSFTEEELNKVCQKFITNETKVVGFSSTFWWDTLFTSNSNKKRILDLIIDYTRTHAPLCKIVCGGSNSGFIADSFIFDKAFKGYNDQDFLHYVQQCMNMQKSVLPFDFNKSFIRYTANDLINQNDTLTIEISRGCIFKCKFCAYPLNGKKKLDYIKDMAVLRNELIENYENYGTTNYIFNDDTFNDSTYKLEQLYEMFQTLPFKIKFCCYLRLDLLNRWPEQIQLLYDMGLRGAFFGIETFNDESAKIIGKGISGNRAKELLDELKTNYWKNKVLITISLIVGLPYETIDNLNNTMSWIKSTSVDSIDVNTLYINNDPKKSWLSEFDRNYQKYGYKFVNNTTVWEQTNSEITTSFMAGLYTTEIAKLANNCNKGQSTTNFATFLVPNVLKFSGFNYSLDDIIEMSGKQRMAIRNYMWKTDCGGLYLNDYKTRLNNL